MPKMGQRESIPEKIEQQMQRIEREAENLQGLIDQYELDGSNAPISVALDEIRDDLEAQVVKE